MDSFRLVLKTAEVNKLEDEWVLYRHEPTIEKSWFACEVDVSADRSESGESVKWKRIDSYYRNVAQISDTSGEMKYPALTIMAKAALALPHGNADVERSFSSNDKIVSKLRTQLSMESIKSIRYMKDALSYHDPQKRRPEEVPISPSLIQSARSTKAAYEVYLESQKESKAQKDQAEKEAASIAEKRQELRRKMEEADREITMLKEEEMKFVQETEVARTLLEQGRTRLQAGLDKNDIVIIKTANEMLKVADTKLSSSIASTDTVRCAK